jgi:cytochrome oxidase Cu insertion factor (SCO1/SenC/PrrC family)
LELREKISGNLIDKNKEILSEFKVYFKNKLKNNNNNNNKHNNEWFISDSEQCLLK